MSSGLLIPIKFAVVGAMADNFIYKCLYAFQPSACRLFIMKRSINSIKTVSGSLGCLAIALAKVQSKAIEKSARCVI